MAKPPKQPSGTSAVYATDADIAEAISSLGDAASRRLARVAEYRARSLRALGLGIDAEDLMQEAIMKTVSGTRRWKKSDATFLQHLIGAMRSIASHEREKLSGSAPLGESPEDLSERPGGDAEDRGGPNLTDTERATFHSRIPDPERVAAVRSTLANIEKRFASDKLVPDLIDGLRAEMPGPDIQQALGITEQDFETGMTRLRRGIDDLRAEFKS